MRLAGRDQGSGTVLVLAMLALLGCAATAVLGGALLLVGRRRAETAADLAALAVARQARLGQASACAVGAELAHRDGMLLRRCVVDHGTAHVLVVIPLPPGRLRALVLHALPDGVGATAREPTFAPPRATGRP